jgi:NADPH2:quinone reductase
VTRPTLATHVATPAKLQAAADELFELVLDGRIKPLIAQRYRLDQVAEAQTALASRATVGSTIFTL